MGVERLVSTGRTFSPLMYLDCEGLMALSKWNHAAHSPLKETAPACGKRVLGRQDYCWIGAWAHRNWVWERPFTVELSPSRVETVRWLLLASTRGLSVEVENNEEWTDEQRRVVAHAALDDLLATWGSRDGR